MSAPGVDDPHTAPDFASCALVTIDVQNDFLSDAPYGIPGTTEVLPALRSAVSAFRSAGRPVIHVVRLYDPASGDVDLVRRGLIGGGVRIAAPGSAGSALAPGLAPDNAPDLDADLLLAGRPQRLGPGEYAVFKPRWGAFYRTSLQELLDELGVNTVVFAGCNLPNCPRASIFEASERDYRVALLSDAVSRVSDSALSEIEGIGVRLLTVSALRERLLPVGAHR
ncbi:cysteine hydrolase family protein [Streptomyces sp. NPDC049687]|uniref:cysteine hydrolase family protein n=1 Tax=Streptomyces sp. NPDC049687 TaxID=3365596 RepID=UPI0037A84A9B